MPLGTVGVAGCFRGRTGVRYHLWGTPRGLKDGKPKSTAEEQSMARRMTPSQFRSHVRQLEQKQKRAIDDYNRAARRHNANVRRAVGEYNRDVRAYNHSVRRNRQRLNAEIQRFNSLTTTTRYVTYRRSVQTLRSSFAGVEAAAENSTWRSGDELFDLVESETANSLAVLNALSAAESQPPRPASSDPHLQMTTIRDELAEIDPDLDARWRGALFSLDPSNPDAARHFCTSSREILTAILERRAPEELVAAANPNCERTQQGTVSRRARIHFCIEQNGGQEPSLETFADDDIANVLALFHDFNDGTHGRAGSFDLPELLAIKQRVEGAVHFLYRLVR